MMLDSENLPGKTKNKSQPQAHHGRSSMTSFTSPTMILDEDGKLGHEFISLPLAEASICEELLNADEQPRRTLEWDHVRVKAVDV